MKSAEGASNSLMATRHHQLGIVDWGIGGISIYKLIKSELGNLPVIYLSDTGVTPYGRMSRRELISRLQVVFAVLRSRGVTHLVVGCNAASTVLPFLDVAGMKVEGVIESAIRETLRHKPEKLALIGGRRTVLSGVYRRAFTEQGTSVRQRIAQPLSAHIESGDVSSASLRAECATILRPIRDCSHLLLACTHYPAIIPVLKEFVGGETVFINPAREVVSRIKRWRLPSEGRDIFVTTGNPASMKNAALSAFGVRLNPPERIRI